MGFLLLMRALFGTLANVLVFYGVFYMPLSLAVVLYYTQPISASLINYFFNGESLSCLQVCSIFSSFVGVIFLSYP